MNRHPVEESGATPDTAAAPTVFVVDSDPSVRESLEPLIGREGWCARTMSSAEEFFAQPLPTGPSCLISEVSLPGSSGLELQRHLAGRPDIPLIFLARHFDIPTIVSVMKAGAVEFLIKPVREDMLLVAIRSALDLSRAARPRQAELHSLRQRYEALSRRERQVMALVVSGLLNKQVAGRLEISEITVKAHRGRVMRKMRVGSLAQLVAHAAKLDAGSLSRGIAEAACRTRGEARPDGFEAAAFAFPRPLPKAVRA